MAARGCCSRPGYVASSEVQEINDLISSREARIREEKLLAEATRKLRLKEQLKANGSRKYDDDSDSDDGNSSRSTPKQMHRPPQARQSSLRSPAMPNQTAMPTMARSPALIHRMQLLEYGFTIGKGTDDTIGFSKPSNAIALPNGDLCVADTGSHRLLIVNVGASSGEVRAPVRDEECGAALRQPRGVACDATALYVSEAGGSRVRKMRLPDELRQGGAATPRGAHIGGLRDAGDGGSAEQAEARLSFPQGVTLSGGELFVCDCEDHRVVVYDALTLEYRRSFGGYGDEEGELSFPYGCAVLGDECIVADTANHRLSVFHKATGTFLRCLGEEGTGRGQFTNPRAVTSLSRPDPSGPNGRGTSVLVTCEKARVQVLTLTGECLEVLEVANASDLWSVCNLRNRIVLVDKAASALHVLNPVFRQHSPSPHSSCGASPAVPRMGSPFYGSSGHGSSAYVSAYGSSGHGSDCASPKYGSGYASPHSFSRHRRPTPPEESTPPGLPSPSIPETHATEPPPPSMMAAVGNWLGRAFYGAAAAAASAPAAAAAPAESVPISEWSCRVPLGVGLTPPVSIQATKLPAPSQNAVQRVVQAETSGSAGLAQAFTAGGHALPSCRPHPVVQPSTPPASRPAIPLADNSSAESSPSPRRPAILHDDPNLRANSPASKATGQSDAHQII